MDNWLIVILIVSIFLFFFLILLLILLANSTNQSTQCGSGYTCVGVLGTSCNKNIDCLSGLQCINKVCSNIVPSSQGTLCITTPISRESNDTIAQAPSAPQVPLVQEALSEPSAEIPVSSDPIECLKFNPISMPVILDTVPDDKKLSSATSTHYLDGEEYGKYTLYLISPTNIELYYEDVIRFISTSNIKIDRIINYDSQLYALSSGLLYELDLSENLSVSRWNFRRSNLYKGNDIISLSSTLNHQYLFIQTQSTGILYGPDESMISIDNYNINNRRVFGSHYESYLDYEYDTGRSPTIDDLLYPVITPDNQIIGLPLDLSDFDIKINFTKYINNRIEIF
jgi:hypothetical protein